MPDDSILVDRCVSGADPDAFSELYLRHRSTARAAAATVCPQTADDAVQEAAIRALRHLPGLRDPQAFGPWFARIAQQEARRVVGRRSATPSAPESLEHEHPSDAPDDQVTERIDLTAAMKRLDPRARTALIEQHVHDRDIADIAREMGIKPSSFKVMTSRGRHQVRHFMRPTALAVFVVRLRGSFQRHSFPVQAAAVALAVPLAMVAPSGLIPLPAPSDTAKSAPLPTQAATPDPASNALGGRAATPVLVAGDPVTSPVHLEDREEPAGPGRGVLPPASAGPMQTTNERPEADPNHRATIVLPTGEEMTVEARLPIDIDPETDAGIDQIGSR